MSTQKLILAGGGDAEQSYQVDAFFRTLLLKGNFLFLPQAISPEIWTNEKSLAWVKKPGAFNDVSISLLETLAGLTIEKLALYDAVYIMGGNTYKLLKEVKDFGLDSLLLDYLRMGKVVYGISAGAILMGRHIETAATGPEKDENLVGIETLEALNLLEGAIVATHYVPAMDKELAELCEANLIICIPESAGVYVNGTQCTVLGPDQVMLMEGSKKTFLNPGNQFELPKQLVIRE